MNEHRFTRIEMLTGAESLIALGRTSVILFGAGGVGSWCAEALVRSGIGRLAVVDSDVVSVTNINRQLQATTLSIGAPKADELASRLRVINPDADVTAAHKMYNINTKNDFALDKYDYVIDAIDSLSHKVDLIMNAAASGATLYSALGAACKIDPTRARVSSIWKSDKCKLGRLVRKHLRRRGFAGDFQCVWSDEPPYCPTQKSVNGSLLHVTGVFGFTLAGLVVQNVMKKNSEPRFQQDLQDVSR